MIWLLIGYMWLFILRPFEIWPSLYPYHIERVYMIFTIVCWLLSGPSLPGRNRLHWCFAGFIVVMLASWLLSPYQAAGEAITENYLKYAVFYVVLVTSVRSEKDLRTIVVAYVGGMTLLMMHSLREWFCGRRVFAQGFNRLAPLGGSYDFNDFAGLIVCSLPFAWVLWHDLTARWKRLLILGYLALASYCIILTGSRMGFCGLVMASMLACLTSSKRWHLLALYPVLFAAAFAILPENQKSRYLTLLGDEYSTQYTKAGSYRSAGFTTALPLFDERPLLGFGPMGYMGMKGAMPHNLYGQLLAELGIAGAVAFGLILWGVAKNTLEARRIVRKMSAIDDVLPWHTVMAASGAVLLLAVMGWGFNFLFWHVWLWYGGFQVVALCCLKTRADSVVPNEGMDLELQSANIEPTCE
jgi:hypothetical protein